MKTKYFWMLMVALFVGTQVMNAQNEQGKHHGKRAHKRMTMEQMVDVQSNKIIGELGLDDKTAAKFKDVYKKYMDEMNALRKKEAPKKEGVKSEDGKAPAMPTDAEVDKMMRERFAISRKMLDIREKYYDEFRKFLAPKQVQKIFDKGQMNRGKFHEEMNRRAGMKKMEGPKRGEGQGQPMTNK